jgi:YfiH family protein
MKMTYTVGRDDVKTLGSISYFEAPSMKALGLVNHAFCTRCGGVSHGSYSSLNLGERNGDDRTRVQRNRDLVVKTFDIAPGQLVTMNQMHGDRIWIIDRPLSPSTSSSEAPYDAILTDQRGIAIGVLTADCVPILLVDTRHLAIGIIHAGWRGTLLGIARKALHKMTLHFGTHPEDLLVAIGPSIGECCYEVDEAVMGPFRSSKWDWQAFTRSKGEHKWFMNLAEATIEQMRACGIRDEQCCCIQVCTACNTDMLFSNRVEGPRTGRQISFIQLREDVDGA